MHKTEAKTPGQIKAEKTRDREKKRAAMLKSMTPEQRLEAAGNFLKKIPAKYRRQMMDRTINELAAGEVFTKDLYGW